MMKKWNSTLTRTRNGKKGLLKGWELSVDQGESIFKIELFSKFYQSYTANKNLANENYQQIHFFNRKQYQIINFNEYHCIILNSTKQQSH